MTDGVKRHYRSPLREEAAQETRRRIRGAATELFVEQGFVATTMKDVAARAGVAERTVYTAYPTKADLYLEAVGVAIVGDDQPIPVIERPEVRAALNERDGRRALELIVTFSVALLERAGDLLMAGVLSSGADPDMRRFDELGAAAARSDFGAMADALARNGSLRDGLGAGRAADVMLTILSPYVHHVLRRIRGWSVEDYGAWLLATLVDQLLPSPTGGMSRSR